MDMIIKSKKSKTMVDISTIQTTIDWATLILSQTGDVSEKYKVFVPLLAIHTATVKMTGSSSDIEILLGTSIRK
jgi:hypothetical protein